MQKQEKWEIRIMHGKCIKMYIGRELVSEGDTFLWIFRRGIKAGSENEVIAAQDEALPTKFHEKVLRTETANKDMSKL
jgi:hypothetical protein